MARDSNLSIGLEPNSIVKLIFIVVLSAHYHPLRWASLRRRSLSGGAAASRCGNENLIFQSVNPALCLRLLPLPIASCPFPQFFSWFCGWDIKISDIAFRLVSTQPRGFRSRNRVPSVASGSNVQS